MILPIHDVVLFTDQSSRLYGMLSGTNILKHPTESPLIVTR